MTTQLTHEVIGSAVVLTPSNMASLGVLAMSNNSVTYNNTTGRDMFADFVVDIGATANRAATGVVSVHFVFSADGTNFETKNITTNTVVGYVNMPTGTGSVRKIFARVKIPPLHFQIYVMNNLAVSLGASGNAVNMYPSSLVQS